MTEQQLSLFDPLQEYAEATRQTAVYPGAGTCEIQALAYVTLGLAGEAGEVANKVKKIIRDDDGFVTSERRAMILKELGGTMWYAFRLADELGVSMADVLADNAKDLAGRQARGTIKGDGDVR